MKVDKAVCTTDTLDDLSRVIKFEAIFSSLVENKILAIKRECEQQKQKSKKKCLLIKKSIDHDQEQPLPHDPLDEQSPKIQPASSSNHFRKILFGKKIFGTKSKFKDRADDPANVPHPDGDHKNVDECELNELNFYHNKRAYHCMGDVEKGEPEMIQDDADDDDDDDDVTIGPDNSSILLSDDATLKSDIKIDIGHLDDDVGGGAYALGEHDDKNETSERPQSCGEHYDRESSGLNKKLRVTYNDRNNCIKTKSNSSIGGGTSSKETSIYIENERTRLRLLEAKSISAQCSPIFQRQKLSELSRFHVTSFDETKKVPHPDYDQITSLPITQDIDHHPVHHPPKSKTTIKINKPRIEYDSIISYNQSTATTTTTSNTSSSPGFISTFNQLTSPSSSNQIPIITTIKSSTSSSTTGSNKSIKSRRLNKEQYQRSSPQNQFERETGAIHKTKQVIDDNQSAINKTNNNSNNSDNNSKINNKNINNNKTNDNNVSNKNSKRNKKVVKSNRDPQYEQRICDDSDEEFRKHRRKYRRTQRYSDPVLVFPSSSGLQHCILSRPPNQPLQLQYDEDFIYDVSLQLEPGDGGDLDDIIATGRRKHRHRHHRHGKKKRHKRRKMLIHDLDEQTVKVIDPDDLPQRARWTIIATAFLLLIMCLLLVGVTLRMAPIIDDMGYSFVNDQGLNENSSCVGQMFTNHKFNRNKFTL